MQIYLNLNKYDKIVLKKAQQKYKHLKTNFTCKWMTWPYLKEDWLGAEFIGIVCVHNQQGHEVKFQHNERQILSEGDGGNIEE